MHRELLERAPCLHALDEALRHSTIEQGHIVLVSGEAGIGKTTLVEGFLNRCPPGTRTLWGACDALFTPRPLGPLYDIAPQVQTPLREAIEHQTPRATLFAAVLDELMRSPASTVLIV